MNVSQCDSGDTLVLIATGIPRLRHHKKDTRQSTRHNSIVSSTTRHGSSIPNVAFTLENIDGDEEDDLVEYTWEKCTADIADYV